MIRGLGSKRWRQRAEEDYALAVPRQMQDPQPASAGDCWDDCLRKAYRELSDLLADPELPASSTEITRKLQATLAKFPLYPKEMEDLTNYLALDLQDLLRADSADQWSEETMVAMLHALRAFDGSIWDQEETRSSETPSLTLRQFQCSVEEVDWRSLCQERYDLDETPKACLKLADDWEVAFSSESRLAAVATVQESYWPLVPEELRVAWDAARIGAAVQLCAPETFWRSPLSRPFALLRVPTAS
ncbi:hypothetical protein AK812_SmicGene8027 [Symbiodinium microadriaticum]|uniref:Uncharacterized protein n=1 Tax=Symbiodinium microadriaticum TaxID=2951 RepID=A0A1Q9EM89_SYMMI|nr:hypothetical protein AK812_SmicGene8027 [Symbiodinium microadriaticum]